jgi:hypothetical protein
MSDEIIYSNLESKPCAGCASQGTIIWEEWSIINDGPDGDWCHRFGCLTDCSTYGDCRCVEILRENRNDTDC